jgi:dihydrofolate reductase
MLVSLIAAMDRRGLIGDEAGLPWHLPADLRRFRALTWGKPILMGRRTFELIGKPLPGRLNVVLTSDPEYRAPGCRVARSLPDGLSLAEDYLARAGGDEVLIIGGGKLYAEALRRWDRLYLTVVEGDFAGSTYFPIRELLRQSWRPVREPEAFPADEKNPHPHSFHVLERSGESGPSSRRADPENLSAGQDTGQGLERMDLAAILTRGTGGP